MSLSGDDYWAPYREWRTMRSLLSCAFKAWWDSCVPLSAPADPCAAPSDVMAPTIGPSCSTAACNYRVVTTLVDIPGDDPAGGAHLPSSGQRLSCETVRLQAPPGRQRRSAPVASCDELAGDLSDRHVVDWDVWTLLEGMCGSDVWSGLTTLPRTVVSRSSLSRGGHLHRVARPRMRSYRPYLWRVLQTVRPDQLEIQGPGCLGTELWVACLGAL